MRAPEAALVLAEMIASRNVQKPSFATVSAVLLTTMGAGIAKVWLGAAASISASHAIRRGLMILGMRVSCDSIGAILQRLPAPGSAAQVASMCLLPSQVPICGLRAWKAFHGNSRRYR